MAVRRRGHHEEMEIYNRIKEMSGVQVQGRDGYLVVMECATGCCWAEPAEVVEGRRRAELTNRAGN